MDRLTQLRGAAGGSQDSTLDTSAAPSEGYITANDSSKYFSLTEEDSSFDISPIKDVSLASSAVPEKPISTNEPLTSNLTPIPKKNDLLDNYKFGKQIEAANILSGGVDIFEDNDNSYDGNELVIDDNVVEIDEKNASELKNLDSADIPYQKSEEISDSLDNDAAIASKDTEVVLQISGKNVQAIDIGNGLYLYRKHGEEELAAVQIIADDHDQPTFKFLKVRENAEGNLEVYEEIEIEVPKEVPAKEGKVPEKNVSHVPIKDITTVMSDPTGNINVERKISPPSEVIPTTSTIDSEDVIKTSPESTSEINLNGKMIKYSETRKSPVIHSTPNKEGIPLTKTMVDLQLHPSRQLDNLKTIEVHIDDNKHKITDTQVLNKESHSSESSKLEISTNDKGTEMIQDVTEKKDGDIKGFEIKNDIEKEPQISEITGLKANDLNFNKEQSLCSEKEATLSYQTVTDTNLLKDSLKKDATPNNEDVSNLKIDEKIVSEKNIDKSNSDNEGTKSVDMTLANDNKDDSSNLVSSSTVKEDLPVMESKSQETCSQTDTSTVTVVENAATNINVADVSEGPGSEDERNELVIDLDKNKDEIHNNDSTNIISDNQSAIDENAGEEIADKASIIVSLENKEIAKNNEKQLSKNSLKTENFDNKRKDQAVLGESHNKDNADSKEQPKFIEFSNVDNKKDIQEKPASVSPENPVGININEQPQLTEIKQPIKLSEAKDSCNKTSLKNEKVEEPTTSVSDKGVAKNTISLKAEVKSDMRVAQPVTCFQKLTQNKPEFKTEVVKNVVSHQKPINNNHAAVPFGKWTEANRQEFLNKIKEAKVPATYSNTKSIKQPNDLNRRDVLQKIDSQRQSSIASSKTQEQSNIKPETTSFTKKPVTMRDSKVPVKIEVLNDQVKKQVPSNKTENADALKMPGSNIALAPLTKQEEHQRKEINNQDLIDKTIEGIINRAVTGKTQDIKQSVPKESAKSQKEKLTVTSKPQVKHPSNLDAIEMKMNELHGIPFVERPPHELPKVYNHDIKTYTKADTKKLTTSKIPSLLTFTDKSEQKSVTKDAVIDLDSEDEVIEHEPITGDLDLHKKTLDYAKPMKVDTVCNTRNVEVSKKETIITENEFDKFARRNSISYENCLSVNFETNKHNLQGLLPNTKNLKRQVTDTKIKPSKHKVLPQNQAHKIQITSKIVPVAEDVFSKNYPSKVQMAYNALTAKRPTDSPVTIIEDKPVKVVFMDANPTFPSSHLNIQGQELSPVKKTISGPDSITVACKDTLDSDVLDTIGKNQDESKTKSKHQRKQVLTPVETPELELIVPGDLGIEFSLKKKKKSEDLQSDKVLKNVVPKKSYLLGRNPIIENQKPQVMATSLQKETTRETFLVSHNDAASAIDNLVKAAELLENQSESLKSSTSIVSSETSQQATPVKRGRGRPRKNPVPDETSDKTKPLSPLKKPRLIDAKQKKRVSTTDDDEDSSSDEIVRENWTMGKINENIVCPICNKLFRSENVVFKHVKHCTGPSPNRSDSDKRSLRRARFSRESDSKSVESKSDDTDTEFEKLVTRQRSPKKRKSEDLSTESKSSNIIVIEDTPTKSKYNEPKQHESRKLTKTKAQYKTSSLSCEYCGKSFRQLSYLVNHKLIHKKGDNKVPEVQSQVSSKSDFSCEVCKKEFRTLHHLVQHRPIHNTNNAPSKFPRKNSFDQAEIKSMKEQDVKLNEDQSAAFRCEPCDKSFRKLHHLVEHRETHDGINRQKSVSSIQPAVEKATSNPPPQCDVCKKTFRKLHHLIEHKEQHIETSSEKSDDKSVKSALSTKDIIHECSLCYMVFPNEHSLNKHLVICQRKKRQSAQKQTKAVDDKICDDRNNRSLPNVENGFNVEEIPTIEKTQKPPVDSQTEVLSAVTSAEKVDPLAKKPEIKEKLASKEIETKSVELKPVSKRPLDHVDVEAVKSVKDNSEIPQKVIKMEEKPQDTKVKDTPKKKSLTKDKTQQTSLTMRRKSNLPLSNIKENTLIESSDDDEVRYMLNPNYKTESSEGKLFMKVRAKKRNSLQFERPNSKDLIKRRTSLQIPPKVPRLKSKEMETNTVSSNLIKVSKTKSAPSTDSDDSEVKYSFPVEKQEVPQPENLPKDKRKSIAVKRKSLSGIARRKSSVTIKHKEKTKPPSPLKGIKKRRTEVEHRCDCGQLFNSAALLARHASLAHTPPRVRRRRGGSAERPPPPPPPPPQAQPAPRRPGRPPRTPAATAASAAHRGVPVPDKMKKVLERLRK